MKFLTEKTIMVLAIILLLVAIFTKKWANMKLIDTDVGNIGLFKACYQLGGKKSCENLTDVGGNDDIKKQARITQVLVILGLLCLIVAIICNFAPKCFVGSWAPSLALLGSILLLASIPVFAKLKKDMETGGSASIPILPGVPIGPLGPGGLPPAFGPGGTQQPIPGKLDIQLKLNYGFSFFLLIAATILALVGSVSGFIERKKK